MRIATFRFGAVLILLALSGVCSLAESVRRRLDIEIKTESDLRQLQRDLSRISKAPKREDVSLVISCLKRNYAAAQRNDTNTQWNAVRAASDAAQGLIMKFGAEVRPVQATFLRAALMSLFDSDDFRWVRTVPGRSGKSLMLHLPPLDIAVDQFNRDLVRALTVSCVLVDNTDQVLEAGVLNDEQLLLDVGFPVYRYQNWVGFTGVLQPRKCVFDAVFEVDGSGYRSIFWHVRPL